jgi:hypothetical protein
MPERRRGFALLITVVLLGFLVLLLVSLATLTRVETAVAANSRPVAAARQHALMAVSIALGQLQKYAGPDNRVTAQASLLGDAVENPWFTGVWDTDTATATPLAWLVSGNESSALRANEQSALNRTDHAPDVALIDEGNAGQVRLVGGGSARLNASAEAGLRHGGVVVPAVAIRAASLPGLAGAPATVGRYAYWVGDDGVKASLGLPDRSREVSYAPWSTPALRDRIRQQIGSGPNYFREGAAVSGLSSVRTEGFDPLGTAANATSGAVLDGSQLALLVSAGGTVSQADFVKDRYHDFTTAAHGVLANTLPASHAQRGLLLDLSTKPDLLGPAFAAYTNYGAYMEPPGTADPAVPPALCIADADSPRRRYFTRSFQSAAVSGLPEIGFSVAPVLASFAIQFQVRRISATNPRLQVRSRVFAVMWNPYSAGLVPPGNLRLEITGLPTIQVRDAIDPASADVPVDLQATNPLLAAGLLLPFGSAVRARADYGAAGELATWLPGRVYAWAPESGASPSGTMAFYTNSMNVTGWTHATSAAVHPSGVSIPLHVDIPEVSATPLTITVKLGDETVAVYRARYDADEVPNSNISTTATPNYYCFAFGFRLNQPRSYDLDRQWLMRTDPRGKTFEQSDPDNADVLIPFNTPLTTSPLPSKYTGTLKTSSDESDGGSSSNLNGNLFYRVMGSDERSMSTYNDVSLFELPRLPLLSLGELQHLQIKDRRPFSIGNSWGGAANTVFDRFFFSGLPKAGAGPLPDLGAGQPMPNWNLKPLDVAAAADLISGNVEETSARLLQAGAFNVNSTSVPAWRAVLSGVRFCEARPFLAADIVNDHGSTEATAGTQNGAATRPVRFSGDTSLGVCAAPVFFRFPQSAQEVFYWSDPNPSGPLPGNVRRFHTSAFRLGARGYTDPVPFSGAPGAFDAGASGAKVGTARHHMTTDQIEVLAGKIVERLRLRAATAGPFRDLETFLSETTAFGGRSLLEDAIDAAGINADEVKPLAAAVAADHSGLSTLTLTQADLLTATAPYLRTRSDTFTIRAYGESINPTSGQPEGRAWAEAVVQRFPETVSPEDSVRQPDGANYPFGRRFKIIRFRWLTSSDI